MTAVLELLPRAATSAPTIWGCTPIQVHDRFWAAHGIQVVRRHERSEIVAGAELYLLCEEETLVLFAPRDLVETLYWLDPRLLVLRVRDARAQPYREVVESAGDRLVRFSRIYRDARSRWTRVALTTDRELARAWQNSPGSVPPWRWLRAQVPVAQRSVRRTEARAYDAGDDASVAECLQDILRNWRRPDATIRRARLDDSGAWVDADGRSVAGVRFEGPVWIGAGRAPDGTDCVVGPAILWDDPRARPAAEEVEWLEIEPTDERPLTAARRPAVSTPPGKRAFDVAFSAAVLTATLPLFPLVALAIKLEDGGPVFFAHRRETVGGQEFPCLKFRSMRTEADDVKRGLQRANEADGPQFYMRDDPRVTRVGRILRKLQIDELPQFLNVLVGHMSVVGPRPSPHAENQCCPAWREARLSVRPGVTGLWQVRRTRAQGLDFQEWIRYDLEYVARASWRLDLEILVRTVGVVLSGIR